MQSFKPFYSKILLFGEYSVISGSNVLSIPFPEFSGKLAIPPNQEIEGKNFRESNQKIIDYFIFLDESDYGRYIDLEGFYKDITSGLYFDSDIPVGYGLGSSGALVASVFSTYGKEEYKNADSSELISILANLESWFHGESSGMDPLSSFMGKALKIKKKSQPEQVDLPAYKKSEMNIYLLDTHQTSATGPLVELYKRKTSNKIFLSQIQNKLIPLTNFCIDSFLKKDMQTFFNSLQSLSTFQYEYFSEMIPEDYQSIWKQGLESGDYTMKLCGSGGGGYLLVFSPKKMLPEPIRENNVLINVS